MKVLILFGLFAVVAMAQQQQQSLDSNSDERERLRECNCVKLIEESARRGSDSHSAEHLRCASVCGKIDKTATPTINTNAVSRADGSLDKTKLVRGERGFGKKLAVIQAIAAVMFVLVKNLMWLFK